MKHPSSLVTPTRRPLSRVERLTHSLRRAMQPSSGLGSKGHDLTGLLLQRVDATRPYSPERDMVLAELVRHQRATQDPAALAMALYAACPIVARLYIRTARRSLDRAELLAEILHAVASRLAAFDPDRRSALVQVGVERDSYHQLWLRWTAGHRERAALDTLNKVAHRTAATLHYAEEPLELAARARSVLSAPAATEIDAARSVLAPWVEEGALKRRDAELLIAHRVAGQSIAAIAADRGMKLEAAKKAIQRAGKVVTKLRARSQAWSAVLAGEGVLS